MQFAYLFTAIFLGVAMALPESARMFLSLPHVRLKSNPYSFVAILHDRKLCTEPYCTARCPDGTPYNCCVVYIRDPCSDHQAAETDGTSM